MTVYTYRTDQELPTIPVDWRDNANAVVDFSSGWTFTAKLVAVNAPGTVVLSKTTGITGAATSPNIVIAPSASDWSGLTSTTTGTLYDVLLYARRTADSLDAVFGGELQIMLVTAPT